MKKFFAFTLCILFLTSALGVTGVFAADSASGSIYSSQESFSELTIGADGTMTSDSGNATLTFTNDQTKQDGTFMVEGERLRIDHIASYNPTTGTRTYSDAKLEYELPQGIAGEVIISMKVHMNMGYQWVDQFDDWLVGQDSDGDRVFDIKHSSNNLFLMEITEELGRICQVCNANERITYLHPSNFIEGERSFRLKLNFNDRTITFYRDDVLTTHGSPEHAYTLRMRDGASATDLKKLTFNFKGGTVATESPSSFSCQTYIDEITIRNSLDPTWSINKTNGDLQVNPNDGQPVITFNTVQTLGELQKIKFYKNNELVTNPAMELSADGKQLTFTEPLTYSSNYKIEIPDNVFEEQLLALPTGSITFATMHKPFGVTVGAQTVTVGSSVIAGNNLSSVPGGSTFTASVNCTGTPGKSFIIIAAIYKNGAMVDINMANVTVAQDGTAIPSTSLVLPADTTGLTYNIFVWENYNTMQIVNP